MQVEYIAKTHLVFSGRTIPPNHPIPPDLLKGRNIAPWIRQGQIELRGPGAKEAYQAYKSEPILGRTPSEALIHAALIAGKGPADLALEKPLLEVDEEYGEALERAGHTVEDAEVAAAEGQPLENEEEVQARLAEGVQRRRRRRR